MRGFTLEISWDVLKSFLHPKAIFFPRLKCLLMNLLRDDLLTFLSDYDRNVAHPFLFHTCVTFERVCLIFIQLGFGLSKRQID